MTSERPGGAVLALGALLLKQDGGARRWSGGGELRQCRGASKGGRGIHSRVRCPAKRATSTQGGGGTRFSVDAGFRPSYHSGQHFDSLSQRILSEDTVFAVTKNQADGPAELITKISAEDSRGRSRRCQRCPCYVWEVRGDIIGVWLAHVPPAPVVFRGFCGTLAPQKSSEAWLINNEMESFVSNTFCLSVVMLTQDGNITQLLNDTFVSFAAWTQMKIFMNEFQREAAVWSRDQQTFPS